MIIHLPYCSTYYIVGSPLCGSSLPSPPAPVGASHSDSKAAEHPSLRKWTPHSWITTPPPLPTTCQYTDYNQMSLDLHPHGSVIHDSLEVGTHLTEYQVTDLSEVHQTNDLSTDAKLPCEVTLPPRRTTHHQYLWCCDSPWIPWFESPRLVRSSHNSPSSLSPWLGNTWSWWSYLTNEHLQRMVQHHNWFGGLLLHHFLV